MSSKQMHQTLESVIGKLQALIYRTQFDETLRNIIAECEAAVAAYEKEGFAKAVLPDQKNLDEVFEMASNFSTIALEYCKMKESASLRFLDCLGLPEEKLPQGWQQMHLYQLIPLLETSQ